MMPLSNMWYEVQFSEPRDWDLENVKKLIFAQGRNSTSPKKQGSFTDD